MSWISDLAWSIIFVSLKLVERSINALENFGLFLIMGSN